MYSFKDYLEENEKILYEDRAYPGKGDKSIGALFFIIIFMLLIQSLMIWSIVTGTGDGANGIDLTFIIIFGVTLLFDGIAVYNIVYNLFLKEKMVADDFYCITNYRVMKYEEKKKKLIYGYLINYEDIKSHSNKGGYGDVVFSVIFKEDDNKETAIKIKNIILHPNPKNRYMIEFESVKKPYEIIKIAKEAREKVLFEFEGKE